MSYLTELIFNSLVDKLTKLKNHPALIEDLVTFKKGFFDKVAGRYETDAQIRAWMNLVREMFYDMEDWIDEKKLATDKEDQLEMEEEIIKKFKAQIEQARDLCTRYGLLTRSLGDPDVVNDPPEGRKIVIGKVTIDSWVPFEDKTGLVAVDDQRNELVKHLIDQEVKMLKVVSIVGMEGLGKTTLAKEIYANLKLQKQFECRAFVTVGRRPSMRATLMDILRQVKMTSSSEKKKTNRPRDGRTSQDLQKVITELWEYLGTKRYFIVVDGLWSTEAWKVINCALPDRNCGSRVLTTTCISDVAKSCCIHPSNVYQMNALSEYSCKRLFQQLIREEWPVDIRRNLKMCDGMPLAVTIAASLLAKKSLKLAELNMLEKSLLSSVEQYSTSEEVMKILHMSYSDLPAPLKSCFLYLSVFPEHAIIKKDHLIRLWEAEGFVPRKYEKTRGEKTVCEEKRSEETSGEETTDEKSLCITVGEVYFNELIIRRLIRPVFNYNDDQAVGCTVHSVVLEFTRSLSSKDNFVTMGAYLSSGLFPCTTNTIRRLSLNSNGDEDDEHGTLATSTAHLSKVRSLTIFGDNESMAGLRSAFTVFGDTENMAGHGSVSTVSEDIKGRPVLPYFKLIQVLDLKYSDNLRSHHLKGIDELVLLKYLALGGIGIHEIPGKIEKLEQLETLDVKGTKLSTLPASIVGLRKLARLLIDNTVRLPSEIWTMEGLEEVSTVGVKANLDSVLQLLRKSERLLALGVSLARLYSKRARSFLKEVEKYAKLMSLSLDPLDSDLLALLLEFPQCYKPLQRFEVKIPDRSILGRDVQKMASFINLTHLDIKISNLQEEGVSALGRLPRLVLLKLVSSGIGSPFWKSKKSSTRCIINEIGFQNLKVLFFRCCFRGMELEFTAGAMPQLRRLWLTFSAMETLSLYGNFDFGIDNLSSLTRVDAIINRKHATVFELENAEAAIRDQARSLPTTIEFSGTFSKSAAMKTKKKRLQSLLKIGSGKMMTVTPPKKMLRWIGVTARIYRRITPKNCQITEKKYYHQDNYKKYADLIDISRVDEDEVHDEVFILNEPCINSENLRREAVDEDEVLDEVFILNLNEPCINFENLRREAKGKKEESTRKIKDKGKAPKKQSKEKGKWVKKPYGQQD